jgi:hypothetical protein
LHDWLGQQSLPQVFGVPFYDTPAGIVRKVLEMSKAQP